MFRIITVVFSALFSLSAWALPQPIETFSHPALEAFSQKAAAAIAREGYGNCPRLVLKSKSVNQQEGEHITLDVNELVAEAKPNEMSYSFGLLIRQELTPGKLEHSLLSLAAPSARDSEKETIHGLASDLEAALQTMNGDFMAGTAQYLKMFEDKIHGAVGEYTLRVVIDHDAKEFLVLGTGTCSEQ